MSDLRDEDLLLGDDIDDQALYGADEDELLLTDEELEKDVTNEEKLQIKKEAEQWVLEQMQEQNVRPQRNRKASATNNTKAIDGSETLVDKAKVAPVAITQVSSTANYGDNLLNATNAPVDDVSTSEAATNDPLGNPLKVTNEASRTCVRSDLQLAQNPYKTNNTGLANAEDAISSSSRDIDVDHASLISCSTVDNITDSSILPSSQDSVTGLSVCGISRDFVDPREDYDDEREERTNIKTTNEREIESASSSDQSPDVHPRYMQNKRFPPDGQHSLIRPYRYSARPPYYNGPLRVMMNRGGYQPMPHASILLGHFPLQHPAPNTLPHSMYAPPITTHGTQQQTHGALQSSSPTNSINSVSPPHEIMPRMTLRHPYAGFRPGAPIPSMSGNFRHPMHNNIYAPQDYNGNASLYGPQYGPNFLPHPPGVRGMFRPELQQGMPPRLPPPPGLRMQRAPLPQHNLPGSSAGFPNASQNPIRPQLPPPQQPTSQQGVQSVAPNATNASNVPNSIPSSVPNQSVRPNKVLINPNFKGGVEAATSKFIQETQYMAAIGGVPKSYDELLRQQEEFINKNRQHIEKRRNERAASPSAARRSSRSRSRSRTRSRSRERSYTPPSKRSNAPAAGDRHFERERERDRDRDRERERERDRERAGGIGLGRATSRDRERERDRDRDRERDRGAQFYGNRVGGNRFRRGNSRDRGGPGEFDGRGGNGGLGNYNKRRRSISPSGIRGSGNSATAGRRGRSNDRDRNEEDDETRAYRLQIEKQKELREKIMRDKEMKRRRAAEEKQHEEKRVVPQTNTSSQTHSQTNKPSQSNSNSTSGSNTTNTNSSNNNNNNNNNSSTHDEPQKLKPIIVTQPKIISLKKRQQPNESNNERHRQQRSCSPPVGGPPQQRRQLPTAKILPEAKRTLTEHLTGTGSGCGSGIASSGHSSNTAIIKPVQKSRETVRTQTPPLPGTQTTKSISMPSKHKRRLSTPSDDEVQLDFDEDELMLDEEDRLLATPTPSPTHRSAGISRTPSPEPPLPTQSTKNKSQKTINTTSSGSTTTTFPSNNRRVVLKSNNERTGTNQESSSSGRNRSGGGNGSGSGSGRDSSRHREGGNSSGRESQSSRKGIFDRLDVRSGGSSNGSGSGYDSKRKAHRIVLKHD